MTKSKYTKQFVESCGFYTDYDLDLEKMLFKSVKFVYDCEQWDKTEQKLNPYWLSFLGKSGVGKSHLAKAIYNFILNNFKKSCQILDTKSFYDFVFIDIYNIAQWWREHATLRYRDVENADFLVIDDIGAEDDSTGFVKKKMNALLDARLNKWTIITSNLDYETISKYYGGRVADRMIRGRNQVINIKTESYSLKQLKNRNKDV